MTSGKLLIYTFILLRHYNMWITKKSKATFHQKEELFSIHVPMAWIHNLTVIDIITLLLSQYN